MEDRLEGLEVGKVIWSGRNNGGGRTRCSVVLQGPQDWLSQLVKNPRLETEPRRTWSAFQLKLWGIFTYCYCTVDKSCLTLLTPWTVALQAPLFIGFPRQEYWSGLPFPFPGNLSDPVIKPTSPALAGRFVTTETPGKPYFHILTCLSGLPWWLRW